MKLWEVTLVAKQKFNEPDYMEEAYVLCETSKEAINMVREKEHIPSGKRLRAIEVVEPQVIVAFYAP